MTLADQFEKQVSTLRNVHFDDAAGRLITIVNWLESEPITKGLLDELAAKVDVAKLFEGAGLHQRPRANTHEEIAAVGLQLIRECRKQDAEFFKICYVLNIHGAYGSTNFQDVNDAGMREYVVPFLDYIAQELDRAADEYSVSTVAENRFSSLLSQECKKLLPKTVENLQRLSSEFIREEKEVAWQNVGNSCRQALIEFAEELRDVCAITLPSDIQAGNVKAIIKHISSQTIPEGRFRDTLNDLIESAWNHAQSITHRNATTKEDALRVFLWTGMVVSEFVEPLRAYTEA